MSIFFFFKEEIDGKNLGGFCSFVIWVENFLRGFRDFEIRACKYTTSGDGISLSPGIELKVENIFL